VLKWERPEALEIDVGCGERLATVVSVLRLKDEYEYTAKILDPAGK
jgi:hypothetical protein